MAGTVGNILAGVAGGGTGNALVYVAVIGTPAPTDTAVALNAAFKDCGWCDVPGLTEKVAEQKKDIGAFGTLAPVRTLKTARVETFDVAFLETSPLVTDLFYGNIPGASVGVVTAALTTPVNATFATAATGGTLAAGTYSYRVSATNANGETLASTASTIATTGATSTATVNWTAVSGATGYRVYGRLAGSEQFIAAVGAVVTYTDIGSASPLGALPTVNTTGTSSVGAWSIATGTPRTSRFSVCFETHDGTTASRIYLPICEGAPSGDKQTSNGDVVKFPMTFTAYPGTDGVAVQRYWRV